MTTSNKLDPEEWETCPECHGKGDLPCLDCDFDQCENRLPCPKCDGTGLRDSEVLH